MGKTRLLIGAACVAFLHAMPASAQAVRKSIDPANDADAVQAPLSTTSTSRDDDSDEVVVTGSRLRDPSFSAPSPLQVLTVEGAVQRGLVSVTQMVQETPAANGTQQNESSSQGRPGSNGGGSTTIDLRGMGSARTLVLLNGHRIGPAGTSGSISQFDLTMLPFAMVSRVDTLTNGASSIYGSDAVAGVVNIITQEDFDGGKAQLYGNVSQHGGGNYFTGSLRYGHRFEKGSLQVGLGYTEAQLLLARQRKVTACDQDYVFNADGTRADITNPDGTAKCWGFGYLYKYAGTGTNSVVGSSASYLRPSASTTVGNAALGDLNGYTRIRQTTQSLSNRYNGFYPLESGGLANGDQAMQSPSRRYSAFASGNYELGDMAEIYGEGLITRRESSQQYLTYFQTPVLPAANPNSPFNVANNPKFVDQAGNPLRPAPSIILMQFAQKPRQQVFYGTATLGVRGKIDENWHFDAYGNFSRSNGRYSQSFVYADRMAAAVSSSGCNTALLRSTNSCPSGGINFWRAYQTGFTPTEYDWLIGRSSGQTRYDQWYVDGSVSGTLLKLPAGEMQLAFGGHFRRESIDDQPGDTSNFDTGAMGYYNSAKRTKGSADVREVYGELGVPILRDQPFAKLLNLTASGRASSFEYGGSSGTYKLGLAWKPADWVMLRATQGTSFRQPKLYELFLQDQAALGARQFLDPCSNYQASTFLTATQKSRCSQLFGGAEYVPAGNANMITGGSTDLRPETSFARTVGIVFSPPILNASLSVDYYYIHIKNSVTRLGSTIIARECLLREPYPGNRFCGLVNRDPTSHQILSISDNYINAGEEVYDGLDIAYSFDFRTGIGQIGSDGQANVQLRSESATFQGDPRDSYLGYSGTPRFLANVGLWYKPSTNTTFRLSSKLVGKMSNEDYFTGAAPVEQLYRDTGKTVKYDRVNEFYANFALSVTTRVLNDLDLSLTVRNLLDSPPPRISVGGTGWQGYREGTASTLSFYDLIGRSFAFSITKGF